MTEEFPPEVVAQIARHMNDDHADDNVLIVRGLGGAPAATAARMAGMDADGMDFAAAVNGVEVPVRIPFRERLTERRQVRGRGRPHVPGRLRRARRRTPPLTSHCSSTRGSSQPHAWVGPSRLWSSQVSAVPIGAQQSVADLAGPPRS